MLYTKDDESYSMYLSRINIQEVLLHAGYVHNRRDGLRYPSYVKLDSDGSRISGEKFIVNPRFNTCYKPPVIKNFNIISLITEHPDMFPEKAENPYRLVHEVCRNILGLPQEERTQNIINPQKEHIPFSLDEYTLQKFDESHVDGYKGFYPYFRYRGIDFKQHITAYPLVDGLWPILNVNLVADAVYGLIHALIYLSYAVHQNGISCSL